MKSTQTILAAALLTGCAPAAMAQGVSNETVSANQSQPAAELVERLTQATAELEEAGFSGFLAVAQPGMAPVLVNAGAADPATGRAYDLETQFDIGSITKPLTGLAAAMLIAEGRLDPEATLADYFDNVPADKAGITVHQMLTHSAGFEDAHGFDRRQQSREEMVAEAFAHTLRFTPGERYAYSNTGYSLVAAIIEDVTGKDYEDFMVSDVLEPLGLTSTGYHRVLDPTRTDASEEFGPMTEASWGNLEPVSWALTGNGGMASSASDLLGLGQMIVNGGLPEEVLAIWTTPRISEGGGTEYGYGMGTMRIDGIGTVVWHNGGNPAFQTEWWTILETGQTILVHRNGGPPLQRALSAALGAATGMELSLGGPDEDIDLTEGPLPPGSEQAELVEAFIAAMESEQDWSAFVLARMSAALLEQMPLEEHMTHYPGLSSGLRSAVVEAHAITDEQIITQVKTPDGQTTILELMPVLEDGMLKLIGIGIN